MRAVTISIVVVAILGGALVTWSPLQSGETPNAVQAKDPPATGGEPGKAKRVKLGNNVELEIDGDNRRVIVQATVCLRQGTLEQLLTRKRTKEHESVLVGDFDAKNIHAALLAAGAKPGSPVKFQPKFTPPTGDVIKVTLEYVDKGKKVRRPAQDWILDVRKKKPLTGDWVFAGSRLFQPPDEKPAYLANDGDVICLSNFDDAMLDLPFDSTNENEQLIFEANTELIPPLETPVTIILEAVPAKKK